MDKMIRIEEQKKVISLICLGQQTFGPDSYYLFAQQIEKKLHFLPGQDYYFSRVRIVVEIFH